MSKNALPTALISDGDASPRLVVLYLFHLLYHQVDLGPAQGKGGSKAGRGCRLTSICVGMMRYWSICSMRRHTSTVRRASNAIMLNACVAAKNVNLTLSCDC